MKSLTQAQDKAIATKNFVLYLVKCGYSEAQIAKSAKLTPRWVELIKNGQKRVSHNVYNDLLQVFCEALLKHEQISETFNA